MFADVQQLRVNLADNRRALPGDQLHTAIFRGCQHGFKLEHWLQNRQLRSHGLLRGFAHDGCQTFLAGAVLTPILHQAAGGDERLEVCHPYFGGLLQDDLHLLTAGQAVAQPQTDDRFGSSRLFSRDLADHVLPLVSSELHQVFPA